LQEDAVRSFRVTTHTRLVPLGATQSAGELRLPIRKSRPHPHRELVMRRNLFAHLSLLAMLLLAAVGMPAHAICLPGTCPTPCAAGNPNTTSVIQSTPTTDFAPLGNNDVTVTHKKTGLMWKRCAEGLSGAACTTGTAANLTWANALKAANSANSAAFGSYTDWRLPNVKELESIGEVCGANPSINQTAFPATPTSVYFWSSSSYVPGPWNAWYVDFGFGGTWSSAKTNVNYVRLVRGGQSVDSFDGLGALNGITPILMLLLSD
jgi:hypothetical protein